MRNLPNTLQEVEYIQSTGTQLIDTGYLITPNTEVSVDYQFTNAYNQDFVFGIGSDSNTSSGVTFCIYCSGTPFKAGISDGTDDDNTWNNPLGSKDTNRHTFVLNNGHSEMYDSNGTLETSISTISTITRTAGHSFGLFCWWRTDAGPSRSNKTAAKLYGCTVKESGTLQRDFVPCYRKSDNEIGLYDVVNDVFYTNAGTGTFAKGPDVIPPKKYIDRYYLNGELYGIKFAGGGGGRQPGEDTLLYLPLESDVVDMSGQATTRVFTTDSLTYTTVDNIPSVHIGSTGGIKLTTPYPLVPKTDTYPCTVSVLVYTTNTNTNRYILDMAGTDGNRQAIGFHTANDLWMSVYNDTTDGSYATLGATPTLSQWNHIVYTITTTSSKLYINGVLVDSGAGNPNYPRGNRPYGHDNAQGIFCERSTGTTYNRGLNGNARELIFEKKERTADEVANYYTWIKGQLGF